MGCYVGLVAAGVIDQDQLSKVTPLLCCAVSPALGFSQEAPVCVCRVPTVCAEYPLCVRRGGPQVQEGGELTGRSLHSCRSWRG